MPTYGASKRAARISSTSTQPEQKNTSPAATRAGIGRSLAAGRRRPASLEAPSATPRKLATVERGTSATYTVMFTDLVGSTAQRTRIGDQAADELHKQHHALLRK